jgi:hypothetical protein
VDFDALLDALGRCIPVNTEAWKAASQMRRR